jgi:hypothetical protein
MHTTSLLLNLASLLHMVFFENVPVLIDLLLHELVLKRCGRGEAY